MKTFEHLGMQIFLQYDYILIYTEFSSIVLYCMKQAHRIYIIITLA